MKKLLTVLGLTMISTLARADYTHSWSCDFGDNYAAQVERYVSNASVANTILKTSNSVRSDGDIFSQTTGTAGTKKDAKYLFVYKNPAGVVCALISPPTEVAVAQTWQLQFDYMPMKAYGGKDDDINGVTVLDACGAPLFTSMNIKGDATIYKGEDSDKTIGTIPGADIVAYNGTSTAGNWFRILLTGDENGVRLTITKLDGNTTIISNASLSEARVAPGKIMVRTGNHGERATFAGIDDIEYGYTLSESSGITEWTSDAVTSSIKFGAALTTEGAVNISGGSVAVPIVLSATDASYGLKMTGTGNMSIGDTSSKGSDVFLVVESGSYTVNHDLEIGKQSYTSQNDWSLDYITMNGGSFTIAENMVYPHGIMNIWGGEWSVGKTLNLANQKRADATIHVYGGVLSAQTINVAPYAGNSPKLYLHGGTLEVGCFTRQDSSSTSNLYFEGGTLKALESDATFAPAGIKFTVNEAGGTLDTNDKTVSVADAIGGTGTLTVTGGGTLTLEAVPVAALNIVDSTVVVPYGTAFTAAVATSGTGTIAVDCTGHQIGDTILTSAVSLAGVSLTITGLENVQANLAEGGQGFVIAEKEEEPVVADVVPMFITGGQSNTDGRLDSNTLPSYLASNARALVSYHAPLAEARLGKFAAYAPCSGEAGQPGKWAYDAELYYHIGNALGKTFYVAKTSYGGTSIRPSINNSPSGHSNAWLAGYGAGYHWSADETFLDATVSAGRTFEKDSTTYDGQSLLKSWIENIDAAIDALKADNKTPDIKAIIWHQGESDGNNGLYASDLTAVVTYVREHLAEKLNDDKYLTLPFFCGNIPRKSSLFTVNLDKNFATIEETADNNMHVVDIYDLTMKSDNKHFDAESAVVFGKRLFNRMIDEGVIKATKVEVADCVREPDFGTEQVINNTTTWTWNDMSGDIATSLTNIDGIYFHAASSNSRKVQIFDAGEKTLNWTIGDGTATVVSKGAYCTAYENNSSAISTTSTAGENNKANYMVAMNAGRSGKFEVFYWAREACTAKLYLNGTEVDSKDASAGEVVRLNGTNTAKSVYYLALGKGAIMGARFVPDEEMPAVTLTIGEDGWGTFGNLYEANFALPDGVKAYAINAIDGQPTFLSMTEVGALNLGDAVVVSGEPGTYTLTPAEGAKYDSENLMVVQKETGNLEETSGSDFINFMQTSSGGDLTFTKSDGTQTLAAGKAFFSITEGDAHSAQQTLNCRNTGDTTKFTWTGKGTDTLWTTLDNWAWPDGKAPLNAPGSSATVTFDKAAEVTFGANTSSGIKIVVNANVSFASDDGTTERIVEPSSITGTGKLTLKNKIKLQTVTYGAFSVDCAVEIEDGASAALYTSGKNAKITINGALTGGGSLTAQNRNAYGSIVLSGDMSGYTGLLTTTPGDGTITVSGDTGESGIAIKAADADAALEKVSGPTRPSAAAKAVTEEDYAAYYKRSAVAKEGADGYFVVTVALDETAVAADETLATVNTNEIINPECDTLTLTNAKPGLYYSIVGGTDVNELNIEGEKALATSDSVSPAKPDFGDDESNVHYFRVRVSSR